ncbi:hypothetical protein DFH06DRAFT_1315960 [Mycena polygramma]|nr:hypothetical protein DFH06DRAFT_1315960 [Mycena polygramma]
MELLVEIFKIVVHTAVCCPKTKIQIHFQELGAFVRKYWRQIVHNTPRLWAQVVVDVPQIDKVTPRYLDGLEALLARSTSLPISVAFDPPESARSNPAYADLARIMAPTARRWKNLKIHFLHLINLHPATFEALERLRIDIGYHFWRESKPVDFNSSPHLRNFTLITDLDMPSIHLFYLPWSQLTHLEIWDISLGACRSALMNCYNLEWAKILTTSEWDLLSPPTDAPITTLPFLKALSLCLRADQGDPEEIHGVEAFVSPLSLPSLNIFVLEFTDDSVMKGESWPTAVFSEFQTRSPAIEDVHLFNSSVQSEELVALLRHGPAIAGLEVQGYWNRIDNHFFDALRYDADDPAPLVPKLEAIFLTQVGINFVEQTLEAAIRSRWWKDSGQLRPDGTLSRVSHLETVFVGRRFGRPNDPPFSDDFEQRVQELVDQGLDIKLE